MAIPEWMRWNVSLISPTLISTLHAGTFDTIEGSLSWDADGATNGTSGLLLQWINHALVPVFPAADAAQAPEIAKPAWGG